MPSIEITQEQADALARGENVSISPKPKTHKNVFIRRSNSVADKTLYVLLGGREDATYIHLDEYLYIRTDGGAVPADCPRAKTSGLLLKRDWEIVKTTG